METVLSLCKFLAISLAFSAFVAQDSLAYVEAPQRAKTPVKTLGKGTSEESCLETVIAHEARGEGAVAQYGVAMAVMNRVALQGKSVCDIIYQKHQFTGLPNQHTKTKVDNVSNIGSMAKNVLMQQRLGIRIDITQGSTHFATHKVKNKWTKKFKRVYSDSVHHFYKEP